MTRVRAGLWLTVLAGVLVGSMTGCNTLPPDCRIGDVDDQQMSTRVLFLERLQGCPIGGRN
ncbi:MAG: hypothetical protein AAF637_06035 [Pseudomonadota bacterium]